MSTDSEDLFGRVVQKQSHGDCKPDLVWLARPFIYGGLIRAFCTGCGEDLEVLPEVAKKMIKLAGGNPDDDMTGKYLEVKACFGCASGFSAKGIQIKSL